ncbi:MAG: YaaC family protein [Actinomycetota bacterium]|nr:YaaC family protein [Actinomycetota bacterium]
MSGEITTRVQDESEREEALAFLDQARQFYATAGTYTSANPLLYYYAFLNLAKPLIRVRGYDGKLVRSYHGLHPESTGSGSSLADFKLVVEGQHEKKVNVFAELSRRLGSGTPATGVVDVEDLMAQVAIGHRLWRQAVNGRERFLGIYKVEMLQDPRASLMWLRLLIKREDLTRFGLSHSTVLEEGDLKSIFREVRGSGIPSDCIAFEQVEPVNYGHRPNDFLDDLVDDQRDRLWRIVSADSTQGYRKYYLHLSPQSKRRDPQLLSMWMLLFHFGSMVRYQPHVYSAMTRGKYGAFIQEFVTAQPEQMLYLLASELCEREVAKPSIA